jgi:hypothetical protein
MGPITTQLTLAQFGGCHDRKSRRYCRGIARADADCFVTRGFAANDLERRARYFQRAGQEFDEFVVSFAFFGSRVQRDDQSARVDSHDAATRRAGSSDYFDRQRANSDCHPRSRGYGAGRTDKAGDGVRICRSRRCGQVSASRWSTRGRSRHQAKPKTRIRVSVGIRYC